jgi:transaldolase
MKATQQLHEIGQSLWLDNISRALLTSGTLERYIREYSITGLTSNPTIFEHALKNTTFYDEAIRIKTAKAKSHEALFFELALEDLTRAADLFAPIHKATSGLDGWVSLEVSPLLAYDARRTIQAAKELCSRANRPNVFIKIPGTHQGLQAIEEAIFEGIPVNVTLLFSREHYLWATQAYTRGLKRRIKAGLDPAVHSVASLFISRWDKAVWGKVPAALRDRLGIAVAKQTYKTHHDLLNSHTWRQLVSEGALVQRLVWASTGTKDPDASDVLYIKALAAPNTINTMPEATLLAFAEHGSISELLPLDGGNYETELKEFAEAGVDVLALGERLQREGANLFDDSWNDLMACIASKRGAVKKLAKGSGSH